MRRRRARKEENSVRRKNALAVFEVLGKITPKYCVCPLWRIRQGKRSRLIGWVVVELGNSFEEFLRKHKSAPRKQQYLKVAKWETRHDEG